MYFSIVFRSKENATLVVVIISSLLLIQMKLAMMFDLIFFKALLILNIYLLDRTMNLPELTKLISTNTYLLDSLFIAIPNFGFSFFGLFIIFCTSSIFFVKRLRKLSLIFTISLILAKDIWIYKQPFWVLPYLSVIFPLSL